MARRGRTTGLFALAGLLLLDRWTARRTMRGAPGAGSGGTHGVLGDAARIALLRRVGYFSPWLITARVLWNARQSVRRRGAW